MLRVNAEYSARISLAFENAIATLRNQNATELADQFRLLKEHCADFLSVTFETEKELLSDTRRFEVETSTRLDELVKRKKRLGAAREEQKERREELESELKELRNELRERTEELRKEQAMTIQHEESRERQEMEKFNQEMSALQQQRNDLRHQIEEEKQAHLDTETKLRDANSALARELAQTISDDHQLISSKKSSIDDLMSELQVLGNTRNELEEYFQRVDENNAVKKKEEEALQRVAEISRKAQELLDNGACQLQRLYRGMRDRSLVQKLKKASKKGKGKKDGKKK
jgi:chromosome segregation ATPase